MASMGADSASLGGNQIFVTLRKGTQYPPTTVDVRVQYHETIGDLKSKVAAKTSVPPEQQQLFWHSKEMVSEQYDYLTLSQLDIHTGFGIGGYDLSEAPDYFPPVFRTATGLMEKSPISNPEYLERHPDAMGDPETLVVTPGVPIAQDPAWLEKVATPALREVYTGM